MFAKKQQVNIPVLTACGAFGNKRSPELTSVTPGQRCLCCETVVHPGNVLYNEGVETPANHLNSFGCGAVVLVAESFGVQLSVTCL